MLRFLSSRRVGRMPFEQALGSNKQGKWDELLLKMFRDLLITGEKEDLF